MFQKEGEGTEGQKAPTEEALRTAEGPHRGADRVSARGADKGGTENAEGAEGADRDADRGSAKKAEVAERGAERETLERDMEERNGPREALKLKISSKPRRQKETVIRNMV